MKDAPVKVEISDEIPKEVVDFVIENEKAVAKLMAEYARSSTAFSDVTGKLRKSITHKKSKYTDGGWIVRAGGKEAPHAHLIEYGTAKSGARSFLRVAKDRVIQDAIRMFGTKP